MSSQRPLNPDRRVTFPHMGEYAVAFATLVELLGATAVTPPRITKRTLELGAKQSPEFVCVPFKYNMGNFMEALDAGANVVVQAGGGCRFGYYAEVQDQILHDLGYEFEFVSLAAGAAVRDYVRSLKRVNPGISTARVAYAFSVAYRQAKAIEAVEGFWRLNGGFERERGAMDRIVKRFLRELAGARTHRSLARVRDRALADLAAVPIDKPDRPLRVAVVGELYAVMEPESSHHLERRLVERGVEVHRWVTLSGLIEHGLHYRRHQAEMIELGAPYVTHHLGADGTESVGRTLWAIRQGFDGVVHSKPFGCMPEVSALAALQRISREHTFPILAMSFDAQTAEAGVATRVEAFCDMLTMRADARASA